MVEGGGGGSSGILPVRIVNIRETLMGLAGKIQWRIGCGVPMYVAALNDVVGFWPVSASPAVTGL
ncbi:MAG: hypothetical protein ACJ8AW_45485 [Rhodopila sp.]